MALTITHAKSQEKPQGPAQGPAARVPVSALVQQLRVLGLLLPPPCPKAERPE